MTHVAQWDMHLYLHEDGGTTTADVVLNTGANTLRGRGEAHCNPADFAVAEIGDELATARALADLSRNLLGAASSDIEAVEGRPVHLEA